MNHATEAQHMTYTGDLPAPLGLDDAAPVLVWDTGGVFRSDFGLHANCSVVFPTKDDALKAKTVVHFVEPPASEPYRIVLEEYVRTRRSMGRNVALVDGDLRILEVYK